MRLNSLALRLTLSSAIVSAVLLAAAAWLAGDPAADSDCSGGTPDANDISEFFSQWLAGGC